MGTRLVTVNDAPALAELRGAILDALKWHELGQTLPHVIVDDTGRIVGRIALKGIVRGAFQSCSLGYWVAAADNGRGFATAAVRWRYTGSRPKRCCTTSRRSAYWNVAGSLATAWRRRTSRSLANGRTTSCTSW